MTRAGLPTVLALGLVACAPSSDHTRDGGVAERRHAPPDPTADDPTSAEPDGGADLAPMAPPDLLPAPVGCATYVAPTSCATRDGLPVYCVRAGETLTVRGQALVRPADVFAALGPGSVVSNGAHLGYFSAADPIRCRALGCDHVTAEQTAADGQICSVTFDADQPTQIVGRGLFSLTAAAGAAAGDYRVGFVSQAPLVDSPDFYLRVAAPTP